MRLGPHPMLLGGAGRHLCPAPMLSSFLPSTGTLPGLSATLSVDAVDAGTSGIKEVRFYWWKWNGTGYYDPTLIGTDMTATGDEYSLTWTFPTCGEYEPETQKVLIQAIGEANCGVASNVSWDDIFIDGRGC